MTRFMVKGPYEIEVQSNKGGKIITSDEATRFWERNPTLAEEKGCYVFGLRASKGMKPIYVGKATISFSKEVFTSHKLVKYITALSNSAKGTPVLFFLCLPRAKGPVNKLHIDELESYLIQAGLKANSNLLNDKKTKIESWSIGGILRDGQGKPTRSAQEFKGLMDF